MGRAKTVRQPLRDRQARNILVEKNLNLVKGLYNKAALRWPAVGRLDPKDVMQEGYLGLIRAAELFDESKGFAFSTYAGGWIFKFMREAAMKDHPVHHKSGLQRGSLPGEDGDAIPSRDIHPGEVAGNSDNVDRILEAADRLPPGARSVILAMLEGVSCKENAERSGRTVNATKCLRFAAIKKLRAELAGEGE